MSASAGRGITTVPTADGDTKRNMPSPLPMDSNDGNS